MVPSKSYIRHDSDGAWRVGNRDISLDSVVIAYQQGFSAETIQQLYPALSLEEVYGAIAFYLANQSEANEYLRQRERLWEDLRERSRTGPSPVVARMRALAQPTNTASP